MKKCSRRSTMRTVEWILKRLEHPEDIVLSGQEEYTLGRSKDSYRAILSLCVSRKHCVFRITENGLTVKDLNSANGTFVNENKIPPMIDVALQCNDRVGIGVPNVIGDDTFVFTLVKNEEKVAENTVYHTPQNGSNQQENKSFVVESLPFKSEPEEKEKEEEEEEVLVIEDSERCDIIDLSECSKDEKIVSRNNTALAISSLLSQASSKLNVTTSVLANVKSDTIPLKREKSSPNHWQSIEELQSTSEQNNTFNEKTNLMVKTLNVVHPVDNVGVSSNDCTRKKKIEPSNPNFPSVVKCSSECEVESSSSGSSQIVVKIEKPCSSREEYEVNNKKQVSGKSSLENRAQNLCKDSFIKENKNKKESTNNTRVINSKSENVKNNNSAIFVEKETDAVIPNKISRPKEVLKIESSFKIPIDGQIKKEIVEDDNTSEIMQNGTETLKQKDKISIDSFSRKEKKMDIALKRSRKELSPDTGAHKFLDPASKKIKLASINRDLSTFSHSSYSAGNKVSAMDSLSGDENPDKWFAKFSRPYLEQLETEAILKSPVEKSAKSESLEVDISGTKRRKEDALKCGEEYYGIKSLMKIQPVVILHRLEDIMKDKKNKNSSSEGYKCSGRNLFENISFERSLKLSTDTPVSSAAHSNDSDSETESQNRLSSIINYSQSDDVIVIDDDDDDYVEDKDAYNLKKESKYDPFLQKPETEKSKIVCEEICVKEEIFDDDDDDRPEEDDDDDDVEILNWVSKLSQSSSPDKEDDSILHLPKEKRRRIIISDSSEDELPLPFQKEPCTEKVIKDTKSSVLTKEETANFSLKQSSNKFHLPQMDNNKILEPPIENPDDGDSDSDEIFGVFKSNKLKKKNVKLGKKSLTKVADVDNYYERKLSNSEISLKSDAEKIVEDTFLEQKNKDRGEINNTLEKTTYEVKVPSSGNEKTISIKKPSNRRTTLLDCALPMKPRTKSSGRNRRTDSDGQSTSKEVQNILVPPAKEVLESRKPSSLNYLSESERKSKVKEDRRVKLKALNEKQKSEVITTDKIIAKVPSKCTLRPKNTISSRSDKLAESLVVSNQNSKSKKEKIKVAVTVKKGEGDVSKSVKESLAAKKISNYDRDLLRDKPVVNEIVSTGSKSSVISHTNAPNKISKNLEENQSVPEIERQVRKLSFKDLPKIPKCKSADSSSSKSHTDDKEKSHDVVKGKSRDVVMGEKSLKPLRSSLKSVPSPNKKTVSFASAESLRSVRLFEIAEGNSLHRVQGKDAPIKKILANQAEMLYDSSKMILNRVITLILQSWNPRWIVEETVIAQNGGEPAPAHCKNTTVSGLCPMLTAFSNYEEYWKIVEPLMLLDLWARVSEDARRPNQRTKPRYTIDVNDIKEANGILTVLCYMVIPVKQERENMHPHVGDLCVIRYPVWSSSYPQRESNDESSNPEKLVDRFAYIESLTRDHFHTGKWNQDNSGDSQNCKLNFVIKLKGDSRISLIRPTLKVMSSIRSELRQFEAVGFLQHTRLCQMILNPTVSEYKLSFGKNSSNLVTKDELNDAQKTAVLKCASICSSHSPKLCLIQGPPGTGKTKVIVNIIKQMLYINNQYSKPRVDKKPRILLCAPSNAAADEMVERLLDVRSKMPKEHRFKMVRTGPKEYLRDKVRGISLDELAKKEVESSLAQQTCSLESVQVEISTLEARRRSYVMACEHAATKNVDTTMYEKRIKETDIRIAELKGPSKNVRNPKISELEREARKKILSYADIVVSTLSSSFTSQMTEVFASRNGRSTARFTCCIIDEATQCKEPECLIPLMFGIEKMILVGDPEQLPATVLSQVAKGKSFGQSLFNRIWNKFLNEPENPVIFLDTQYRMHPDIYKWPNTFIYNGKVRTDRSALFQSPLKPYCVLAHNFQQHNQLLLNSGEALLVAEIAKIITQEFHDYVKTIGIITPYQKQLQEIKNHTNRSSSTGVNVLVNTIDGFQGRECDVIIFSCVRTRGLGFMGESQRLNVALTRARTSLIICGNFISLQDDKMWSSLLADAMQRGVLIDAQKKNNDQETLLQILLRH